MSAAGLSNLPFGMYDVVQTILTFDQNKPTNALYGQFDKQLAHLEQKLSVDIRSRGNQLIIKGSIKTSRTGKACAGLSLFHLANRRQLG